MNVGTTLGETGSNGGGGGGSSGSESQWSRVYRGCVYQSPPERQGTFEDLTREELAHMVTSGEMIGKPVLVEHHDNWSVGEIVGFWQDPNLDWSVFVDFRVNMSNDAGRGVTQLIENRQLLGLSLSHYAGSKRGREVSLCLKGKRDGTYIINASALYERDDDPRYTIIPVLVDMSNVTPNASPELQNSVAAVNQARDNTLLAASQAINASGNAPVPVPAAQAQQPQQQPQQQQVVMGMPVNLVAENIAKLVASQLSQRNTAPQQQQPPQQQPPQQQPPQPPQQQQPQPVQLTPEMLTYIQAELEKKRKTQQEQEQKKANKADNNNGAAPMDAESTSAAGEFKLPPELANNPKVAEIFRHGQLPKAKAQEIADYILSLEKKYNSTKDELAKSNETHLKSLIDYISRNVPPADRQTDAYSKMVESIKRKASEAPEAMGVLVECSALVSSYAEKNAPEAAPAPQPSAKAAKTDSSPSDEGRMAVEVAEIVARYLSEQQLQIQKQQQQQQQQQEVAVNASAASKGGANTASEYDFAKSMLAQIPDAGDMIYVQKTGRSGAKKIWFEGQTPRV